MKREGIRVDFRIVFDYYTKFSEVRKDQETAKCHKYSDPPCCSFSGPQNPSEKKKPSSQLWGSSETVAAASAKGHACLARP